MRLGARMAGPTSAWDAATVVKLGPLAQPVTDKGAKPVQLNGVSQPGQGQVRVFFRALPRERCRCGWVLRRVAGGFFGTKRWDRSWCVLAGEKLYFLEDRNQIKPPDKKQTVELAKLAKPPALDPVSGELTLAAAGKAVVLRPENPSDAAMKEMQDLFAKISHVLTERGAPK